jgi:hypothetical protein
VNAEGHGHRDTDASYVLAVPRGFNVRVDKSPREDLADWLAFQVVLDPKKLLFVEHAVQRLVRCGVIEVSFNVSEPLSESVKYFTRYRLVA